MWWTYKWMNEWTEGETDGQNHFYHPLKLCLWRATWWLHTKRHNSFANTLELQLLCINSLWPSDSIWQQRTGPTVVQVIACCLKAPSHYLNQCWHFINKVQWHSSDGNFTEDTSVNNHSNQFEYFLYKISFKSPRGQWVQSWNYSDLPSPQQ